MTPIEEFQANHGQAWSEIVQQPAFAAALAVANAEKIQGISVLTTQEIAANGPIILSDLVGHLQYESALLGLHEKKEFVFQQLGAEEYPDPISEASEELAHSGDGPLTSSVDISHVSSIHDQLFPKPKPKRRPPKRKRKK